MRLTGWLSALALTVLAGTAPAQTPTRVFRLATSVDAATLDPHANNALYTYLLLQQIYEPLTHRADDLTIEPGLAERWEQVEPTRWRFHLRRNARFAGGEAFEADDVVFSLNRARAPNSNFGIYVDTVSDVLAVDAHTVDIITRSPDAVVPDKLTRVLIMDRGWAEANGSTRPQNFAQREELHVVRNANGTGPYMIRSREIDQRTIMVRNPNWWGSFTGNVTEYHHITLASDATRIAALLSGEVDFVHVVPVQDVARIRANPRLAILEGQENRTVFLGFRQDSEELPGSDIRGRNPFQDIRVRQAVAHAVDVEGLRRATLRGQAVPTGSMWTQYVNGYDASTNTRLPLDRARARQLLAEAGYPNGFTTPFECPIGNFDEACQAIASMLAQVGIRAQLSVLPSAVYGQRMRRQEVSLYGLSWGVPTFDASYTLRAVMASRALGGGSTWNAGGWSNPAFDAMLGELDQETDPAKRREIMVRMHRLHNEQVGHVPLYHIMIPWAHRQGVRMTHRADNQVVVRTVVVD